MVNHFILVSNVNIYSECFDIRRGLIGPSRQFGKGALYYPQLYALIIGVFLPIPFWLWHRRYPSSWARFISTPVVLNGVSFIPPATGINYSSWFAVGFIFQYIVRKRNFAWWSKFNYVTSSALDAGECFHVDSVSRALAKVNVLGTVLSLVMIFFTLQVSQPCSDYVATFRSDGGVYAVP